MKTRRIGRTAAGCAVLLGITLDMGPACAATVIAGDLDYAVPIQSNADSGAGAGVRFGWQAHLPFVVITPEVGLTYHAFAGNGGAAYRGVGGLRFGVGEIIRPGVFAHFGIGRLALPNPDPSHTAITYDVGAFLDATFLPVVNVGIHAAYNHLSSGNPGAAFAWATIGAHAALVF